MPSPATPAEPESELAPQKKSVKPLTTPGPGAQIVQRRDASVKDERTATVAHMDAPPAPTAGEWAAAAAYTLKNSKRYRYTWGQQVRSMMGTAYEGIDQGVVRFRIEIAPNGDLASLTTLWSTSDKAEQLARQAIANMPPLPPTPTGKPLIFEKTISFQPFASDDRPIYRNDCEPDPPAFRNPFVWDGGAAGIASLPSKPDTGVPDHSESMSIEDCLKQLPQDTLEAEADHDQRLLKQWRSHKLGR